MDLSNMSSGLEGSKVEFIDEEETGLSPTLEFFALVAGEFQRSDLAMWLSDDTDQALSGQDVNGGEKQPGYYVLKLEVCSLHLYHRTARFVKGWLECSMFLVFSWPRLFKTPDLLTCHCPQHF